MTDRQMTAGATWHHKQAQRWAQLETERPILAVTDADRNTAFMRFMDNMRVLKNHDRVAWDCMNERMDKGGETWQAIDADVCRELDRLGSPSEQAGGFS